MTHPGIREVWSWARGGPVPDGWRAVYPRWVWWLLVSYAALGLALLGAAAWRELLR